MEEDLSGPGLGPGQLPASGIFQDQPSIALDDPRQEGFRTILDLPAALAGTRPQQATSGAILQLPALRLALDLEEFPILAVPDLHPVRLDLEVRQGTILAVDELPLLARLTDLQVIPKDIRRHPQLQALAGGGSLRLHGLRGGLSLRSGLGLRGGFRKRRWLGFARRIRTSAQQEEKAGNQQPEAATVEHVKSLRIHVEEQFSGPDLLPSAGPPSETWNLAVMDEMGLLEKARQLAARERQVRALYAAAGALCPGALLALVLVLLLGWAGQPAWQGLAPLVLLPTGAALAEFLRPLRPVRAAYLADRNLGLQERMGTAVEWLVSERPRNVMAQGLLGDAAHQARQVLPRAAFPQNWPTRLRTGLLLALLTVTLAILPADLLSWHGPDPEVMAAAREQARELRRDLELVRPLQDPRLEEIQTRLETLERALDNPQVDAREVLERLTILSQELQAGLDSTPDQDAAGKARAGREQQTEAARRLREAARALAQEPDSGKARTLLRQLADDPALSEELRGAASAGLEALEEGNFEGAEQALARAGDDYTEDGGREEISPKAPGEEPGVPGEGQQALANQGQEVRPGQGEGQADFGRQTTLQGQEAGQTEARDFVLERQSHRTSDWSEEYRRLHPPRRDHLPTADDRVPGRPGPGPTLPEAGQALGRPRLEGPGPRQAPPGDSFLRARESAEAAVAREEVPMNRRDLVRNYFEGIDPRT